MIPKKLCQRQEWRNLNNDVNCKMNAIVDMDKMSSNYSTIHYEEYTNESNESINCTLSENHLFSNSSHELNFQNVSSASDSDIEDFERFKPFQAASFTEKIAGWAVECRIPHSHLNKLLSILKEHDCFTKLPKDSRTLLKTPRQTVTKPVFPGLYSHFGLAKGLEKILDLKNDLFPTDLELLINVDGLPLSKSSGS